MHILTFLSVFFTRYIKEAKGLDLGLMTPNSRSSLISFLDFILESLWMLIGMDFYWKCIDFQLNRVFNATVKWPATWKVFKNSFMIVSNFFISLGWVETLVVVP